MQSRDRPLEQERVPEVPLDGGAGETSSPIDPRWCHGKASSQASDYFQIITQTEDDKKSKGNITESESNPNSICQKVKVMSADATTNSLFRELEARGLADVYGRYPTIGQINTKKFYMLKQSQAKPSDSQI